MHRLVVVIVTALALAACGQARAPQERLSAASAVTSAADTARVSMDVAMEVDEGAAAMNMTMAGEGAIDFVADTARMEMDAPGPAPAMATVVDGDTVYTRVPAILTGGEPQWVRQQASEMGGMGIGAPQGLQGVRNDPAGMVKALDDVSGEVTELGDDEVRGEPVQGYEFTLTGAELADSAETPEALADLEIPTQAWVDADDRLRRMVTEIDMSALAEAVTEEMSQQDGVPEGAARMMKAMSGTMTLTVELFGFGDPVDIAVPDDADVVDSDEFEPQMGPDAPGLPGGEERDGQ